MEYLENLTKKAKSRVYFSGGHSISQNEENLEERKLNKTPNDRRISPFVLTFKSDSIHEDTDESGLDTPLTITNHSSSNSSSLEAVPPDSNTTVVLKESKPTPNLAHLPLSPQPTAQSKQPFNGTQQLFEFITARTNENFMKTPNYEPGKVKHDSTDLNESKVIASNRKSRRNKKGKATSTKSPLSSPGNASSEGRRIMPSEHFYFLFSYGYLVWIATLSMATASASVGWVSWAAKSFLVLEFAVFIVPLLYLLSYEALSSLLHYKNPKGPSSARISGYLSDATTVTLMVLCITVLCSKNEMFAGNMVFVRALLVLMVAHAVRYLFSTIIYTVRSYLRPKTYTQAMLTINSLFTVINLFLTIILWCNRPLEVERAISGVLRTEITIGIVSMIINAGIIYTNFKGTGYRI